MSLDVTLLGNQPTSVHVVFHIEMDLGRYDGHLGEIWSAQVAVVHGREFYNLEASLDLP